MNVHNALKPKWEIDLPAFDLEIKAFESQDEKTAPFQSGVLFIGSSSIRMWPHLQETFAPWPVLNRGFGGSCIAHSALFAPRILGQHTPQAIVFFAGDNDLEGGLTPAQVARDFERFCGAVFERLPDAKIAVIAVKPTPRRMPLIAEIREANRLIRVYVESEPRLFYLDVFTSMLDEKGNPRGELYADDGVHLSPQGYALWTRFVRDFLEREVTPTPQA